MDDLCAALADPTRRLLLDELADRDGQALFELCTRLITRHGIAITRQGSQTETKTAHGSGA